MIKSFYVRFADSKKAKKVSVADYRRIFEMAVFYKALIKDVFHPHGKTLYVSFSEHFV